jgi:integrase
MGTKLPFCILRGTTFYWRRRLPSPFKMSVEFSLGTKDLRVARGLSSMLTIETDRAFAVLREGKMTPEQVDTFARQKFAEHSARLSAVHLLARDRKTPWQDEIVATRAAAIAMSLLAHHGRSAQLSDFPGMADGEFGTDVMQRAQAMLETYGLDYWSDARAKRLQSDLAEKLSLSNPSPLDVAEARSATLEAYAAAGAATAAKFSANPRSLDDLISLASRFSDPVKMPPASEVLADRGAEVGATSAAPHFSTAILTSSTTEGGDACGASALNAPVQSDDDLMAFARSAASFDVENKTIRASTASQKLQVFALFVAVTGKRTFQGLRQADVKKFVDVMAMLPKVRGRSVAEQAMSLEELLIKGRSLPKTQVGLAAATVNRNLSYLTKLMRQARMAGLEGIPQLEISGFRMKKKGKASEKRPAYSTSDVETLFRYTIWTGCLSAARRHIPGNHIVWDGLYWCPLISAYSGARLEEIAALSLAEVILDHPVPHFVFRENESRGLKTMASERKVPIHPVLIELGFIRYVFSQNKLKKKDLFPDLRPNAGTKTSWGDRTHYGFNIAVANALGAARVQNDKNKTFHSFRHYICTELGRFKDLKDKTIQDIVGHENVGTTDRIYKDPTELEVMLEALSRLPDLTKAAFKASSESKIIPARRKATKTQVD